MHYKQRKYNNCKCFRRYGKKRPSVVQWQESLAKEPHGPLVIVERLLRALVIVHQGKLSLLVIINSWRTRSSTSSWSQHFFPLCHLVFICKRAKGCEEWSEANTAQQDGGDESAAMAVECPSLRMTESLFRIDVIFFWRTLSFWSHPGSVVWLRSY